jgi:ribosomal protein S24E
MMKFVILSQKNNPLLKRKELIFQVDNVTDMTRFEIRKRLASFLNENLELIFVKKVEIKTGSTIAVGVANIYNSIKQAKLLEPKHIIDRNTLPEKT